MVLWVVVAVAQVHLIHLKVLLFLLLVVLVVAVLRQRADQLHKDLIVDEATLWGNKSLLITHISGKRIYIFIISSAKSRKQQRIFRTIYFFTPFHVSSP